ncbi:ABC transporter ATP-binding protein [Aliarcobacter skirrowii]|uniref:ABC transporter ATP-binding protein n=1 Tax=Aliarcobacter skirrowii CCUG 10374 TaxID=1032239 RepID=A0AAD0SK38_9BACT|nr:ABC transporter ATP-binding protein [Aliarcobacter skirrowii]AXX84171.1 ABC transporter, ATP-binding/permease components [Aliarcobacter skirrowii CCUG 10374]KAB0621645.1 ABC transporter ATP-binding protein [Aliarcobacter skirrowii CCUG 10374]RXI26898.1 ABC transporter ATP-binding protein [Aliarcobacter skirrowii CCUG 10374]SUV14327.1 Iron import ATP-binding/permease protein IrtA [Aliarcobacter skirrowii]
MNKQTNKKSLWSIIAPVNSYIRLAMVISALSGILSVIGLVFLAYVIGLIMGGTINLFGFKLGFQEALILLASITILSFLTKFYSFVISHLGAFKLEQTLRTEITTHLAQIPLGHIITLGTGAIKKVLLDDVKNLHAFVADTTPMLAKAIVAPLASMIALFVIDYRLGLVAIAILLVGAVLMRSVMKDSVMHRENYEQSQGEINKAVIEFVQAMPVVRTFDDGTTSFKRYNDALAKYRINLKAWFEATSTPAKIAMTVLSPMPTLLAVTITGLFFLIDGSLSFSPFIAALLVSTGMADALMPLMWMSNFVKKSSAAAIRIQEIMDIPVLNISKAHKKIEATDIVFENVDFKYNEKDNYALKNINFEVKANTVTALVGPSGAGKSTVAKLIPRFWDVTNGSIKIGGVDIKDADSQSLMDTVSFVFQDTFLFNDTLSNNIKMANSTATDEDMIEACKAAQIHDFILSLPDAYETMAGDRGANLSGGQKQRITIARAILRNTPIIVLDEATAFADPENEEEIIKALANLMKNKTVIVIAHRLSTIKDVDQILVFDNAEVKEKGKHEELLAIQDGIYAKLWSNYEKAQNWDIHHIGGVK